MPRPCQKRRASARAQQKPKAAVPPLIRHKARQKAIHNARRVRGRSQNVGGHPLRNQQSGNEREQEFISFAKMGNNFTMLKGLGNRHDANGLDLDLDDDELLTDDDSDENESENSETYDHEDMMINVQQIDHLSTNNGNQRPEVMYTIPAAVIIYRDLLRARFPLHTTRTTRYGLQGENHEDTASNPSFVPSPTEQPIVSSTTSITSHSQRETQIGKGYVFDWGKHAGKCFMDVPENYLRTIGGQLDIYEGKHPGLRQAFEYHRPKQARSVPIASKRQTQGQIKEVQASQPQHRPPFPRGNKETFSESYIFTKGRHKGKKLTEVPESYLQTLEGMPRTIAKWPGLVQALQDFNEKACQTGKI